MRWQHPRMGELTPAEFLTVAQEAGLAVDLGRYVLVRAVREAARWQKELPRPEEPLFVSVNISSRELFSSGFVQELRSLLGREAVPRGALKLEVTEQLVMENPEQATELLEWLHKAGASVAIDDFGTGYSALSYLSRFAFDTIKIDRSFLQDLKASADAAIVVRSIVSLAHGLGRAVIAEGVETEEDVVFLRGIGCELGQGFLLSEPLTEKQAMEVLRGVRKDEARGMRGGFLGRVIGNVIGRREDEGEEVVLTEPVRPAPVRPVEGPRGVGEMPVVQQPRPPTNGPPTVRTNVVPHTIGPGGVPPTGRLKPGPAGMAPPSGGRPVLATFERRPNGGALRGPASAESPPMVAGPGLAGFEPGPPITSEPASATPVSSIADSLQALDPALEQRIRSIFRDTARAGDSPAGTDHGAPPRKPGSADKDRDRH